MQLNALEFASLIKDLKCDVRPDERRSNPRAPTRSLIEVVHVLRGVTTPAVEVIRVRDISRDGLGLISGVAMNAGGRMLVLLPKSATETFVLLCEIARVTRLTGGAHGLGVRMVRRVSEAERAAFMRGCRQALASLLAPCQVVAQPAAATAAAA